MGLLYLSLKIKRYFLVQTTQASPGVKLPLPSMITRVFSRGDEILTRYLHLQPRLIMSKIFSALPTCLYGLDRDKFTNIVGC